MANSIKNIEKLFKKLNNLGGNAEEAIFKSLQRQGELVKGEAKGLCTVDTGDLEKSIYRNTKRYKGKIVATVYTNSDHAVYAEFGTGKVGERTNTNTMVNVSYKQDKWLVKIPEDKLTSKTSDNDTGFRWTEGRPAQPYLYPALKNNEDKIKENIANDLKKAIKEVANR